MSRVFLIEYCSLRWLGTRYGTQWVLFYSDGVVETVTNKRVKI